MLQGTLLGEDNEMWCWREQRVREREGGEGGAGDGGLGMASVLYHQAAGKAWGEGGGQGGAKQGTSQSGPVHGQVNRVATSHQGAPRQRPAHFGPQTTQRGQPLMLILGALHKYN